MKLRKQIGINDLLSISAFAVLLFSSTFETSEIFYISIASIFLCLGISSAVHSADMIAQRLGPSLGTLILALSVTIIEVALILSLMSNQDSASSSLARDTVFASIMIVTNGIMGVCVLLGSLKHKELSFQTVGTSALLAVLAVLSTLTMVLPNYTTSVSGPEYSSGQLIYVSAASVLLYILFIFSQTKSDKNFYEPTVNQNDKSENEFVLPNNFRFALSFVTLILSLIAVVGIAKILSPAIEQGLVSFGAPKATVGIVVALLVLAPEAFAAIHAARVNRLQTSLNLALGSGAASIALTIPAVSIYSLMNQQKLTLGLDHKSIMFLALTFIVGSFTVGAGRLTRLHGIVHLVIMISYLALSLMP